MPVLTLQMLDKKIEVLFVSRRGSVRSILAAALLRHYGKGRFLPHACGVGRETEAQPHPLALSALRSVGIDAENLAAQDWSTYSRHNSAPMNYVILLDESAANNMPTWPGHSVVAVWEYPDVVDEGLSEVQLQAAMSRLLFSLRRRIELFSCLPFKAANRTDLTSDVRDLAYFEPYQAKEINPSMHP